MAPALSIKGTETSASPFCGQHSGARNGTFISWTLFLTTKQGVFSKKHCCKNPVGRTARPVQSCSPPSLRRDHVRLRSDRSSTGDDLRRETFENRTGRRSPRSLTKAAPGLRLNQHIEADGSTVFAYACKMGLKGIASKRESSPYRSGRSPDWLKSKNPRARRCGGKRRRIGSMIEGKTGRPRRT